MNKFIKTAALASVGLALAASSAKAVTYANEDVLLSFAKPGSSTDLIVDLGPVSAYTQTSSFDLSTVGFSDASLLSQFGGSLNGVGWAVWAGDNSGTIPTGIWVSGSSSAGQGGLANALAKTIASSINGFGGNDIGGSSGVVVAGSPTEYTVPVGNTFSFTSYGGKIQGNLPTSSEIVGNGGALGTTGYFTDITPSKSGGSATVLGDFTINATTGDAMWNGANSAVPEPATYGLLAGAGLLVLSLRRQISRVNA
jgi:hypothetical protein